MSRNSRDLNQSRRSFLRDLALAGGAAAAAGATAARAAPLPAADPAAEARPKGYRVTPHVSTYYAKARF